MCNNDCFIFMIIIYIYIIIYNHIYYMCVYVSVYIIWCIWVQPTTSLGAWRGGVNQANGENVRAVGHVSHIELH